MSSSCFLYLIHPVWSLVSLQPVWPVYKAVLLPCSHNVSTLHLILFPHRIRLCLLLYFESLHNLFMWNSSWAGCDCVLWSAAVVPLSVLSLISFSSNPLSAVQPHSHSSSLSSIELVSASDDIHRFSAQVLYLVNREHLYLQGNSNTYFSLQLERAWADSMTKSANQSPQDFTNYF